jgi:hypothetical protein
VTGITGGCDRKACSIYKVQPVNRIGKDFNETA